MKIKRSFLKQLIRECVVETIENSSIPNDSLKHNKATPISATVIFHGKTLTIGTSKGHINIILTPEQVAQLKVNFNEFAPGPRQRPEDWQQGGDDKKLPLVNKPLSEVGTTKSEKLLGGERTKIGKAFTNAGLDGNGRFESISKGLHAVTNALSTLGFNLDMVSADMIMGDRGNRNLPFRRTNDEGQDIFTEKPMIENSRIAFTWENLATPGKPPRYEILAYAS